MHSRLVASLSSLRAPTRLRAFRYISLVFMMGLLSPLAMAQTEAAAPGMGGEASLKLPSLRSVEFLGMSGHNLLLIGIVFCIAGLVFALVQYVQLKTCRCIAPCGTSPS